MRIAAAGATQPCSPFRVERISEEASSSNKYLQVPACDTETFYGGYEECPAFRDMFTTVSWLNRQTGSIER